MVIAIIAILAALLLPALSRAKGKATTVKCASNMRNWSFAVHMYEGDNNDSIPYFAVQFNTLNTDPYIFEILAPYVARQSTAYANSTVQKYELRQCRPARRSRRARRVQEALGHYQLTHCRLAGAFVLESRRLSGAGHNA